MQTELERPPAPPFGRGYSKPRRRRAWLRWTLLGLLVLVLAAAGTGLGLALNYQPITPGYTWGQPAGVVSKRTPIGWLGVHAGSQIFTVRARHGLTFTYRFSVYNRGRIPITVTRVGFPEAEQSENDVAVVAVRMRVGDLGVGPGSPNWVPIRTFTLASRDQAEIEMHVTVRGCQQRGTSVRWNREPFHYRVFGIPHTDWVTLPVQITLVGTERSCS